VVHSSTGRSIHENARSSAAGFPRLGNLDAGTVYYAYLGPHILETTAWRYWFNFVLSPIISGVICIVILRWRHVAPANWTTAMLLLAIPGMIGEAAVLSHLGTFMPRLHAESGGKYGAYLFATYAIVLGLAEVVSFRAAK
jgi:Family of unknown function (DUF5367)